MIDLSVPVSAFGFAPGIADADRIEASAKVQAANQTQRSDPRSQPSNILRSLTQSATGATAKKTASTPI